MTYSARGTENPAYIFPMKLSESIRKYRKAKGLTQAELAQKLGTAQYVITNYERGLRRPSSDKIPLIAEVLGVTLEDRIRSRNALSTGQGGD